MKDVQYLRKCTLLLSNNKGDGLDLSLLHIKFTVKRSNIQSPNMAEIRVYNLEQNTINRIEKEFKNVILQAGYESNFGVIFQGNIKQILKGQENSTDKFVDLIVGDGDLSYNFAVVNTTLAAGSTQREQINAAVQAMSVGNTTLGHVDNLPPAKLPRGKVMFGMSRDYLKQSAETSDQAWSIQNGQVQFVPLTSYLPGEAVVLTSKTGMIGTPTQTNEGINVTCLLNPKIKIGGRVSIDNKAAQRMKIDISQPGSPANIPAPLSQDGVYFVLSIEYVGDTRGQDWYSKLICLQTSLSSNPMNAVSVG